MSPRELALLLLRHRFGSPAPTDAMPGLAAFQADAVPRLERALERYGGALLADSVGLGKTHVAAALVRRSLGRGGCAGVIVPTPLVRQWRRALRGLDAIVLATHAQLSRGGRPQLHRATLLVVDEAHAFRNPHTHRYAALARLCAGRSVLLVTATPVNNSLRDLYWLLRLFAADDAFVAAGVADLFTSVREAERAARYGGIAVVLGEVAVRRTRALPLVSARGESAGDLVLRFPARAPPVQVDYSVDPFLQRRLLACVEQLRLTPWMLADAPANALLLRLVLLKRLESSHAAFTASLRRLLRLLRDFAAALHAGRLLTPADRRAGDLADADQLAFDALLLRPLPSGLNARALLMEATSDIAQIEDALATIAAPAMGVPGVACCEPKIARLRTLLADELGGRQVVVFTEFRDTAIALWRGLAPTLPTALIHGGGAWLGRNPAPRRVVVERFAPRSNGVAPPRPHERPRVLIATDVLAEGLNLQDAADLISFDLPWNPVRLLQRMGRIDRLGSPHAHVRGWYFAPEAGLDAMLRLLQRLHAKIAAIRGSVGEDGEVLATHGAEPVGPAGAARPTPTDRAFELEERLRAAWSAAEGRGAANLPADPLAGLPLAAAVTQACRPENPTPAPAVVDLALAAAPRDCEAVLFFEHHGRQRAVLVGRRIRADPTAAAQVLLGALEQDTEPPAPHPSASRGAMLRAQRWLLRPPAPRSRRASPARALRERLLHLLQQRPGGPTAAECERVERVVRRLAGRLHVAQELALQRVSTGSGFERFAGELEAALGTISHPPEAAPQDPATTPQPRFLGGFRLFPGESSG